VLATMKLPQTMNSLPSSEPRLPERKPVEGSARGEVAHPDRHVIEHP